MHIEIRKCCIIYQLRVSQAAPHVCVLVCVCTRVCVFSSECIGRVRALFTVMSRSLSADWLSKRNNRISTGEINYR